MHTALAVAAALVALAFACSTYERWLARRRRHELAWSLALGFFSVAAFALAAGAALGWSEATFKVFYLFGAIVNVPFLALGTVYLLGGQRRGDSGRRRRRPAVGVRRRRRADVDRSPVRSRWTSSPRDRTCSVPVPASSPPSPAGRRLTIFLGAA